MNYKEFRDQQINTNPKFKEEYFKKDLRFDVSQLITEARYYKNLSQEKLAKLVGTKQPSIVGWRAAKLFQVLVFLKKLPKHLAQPFLRLNSDLWKIPM